VSGWNRIHGTQHVVLRFANVYGPRQSPTLEGGVIAIFLDRMAADDETTIFGDGGQTRDFVYVADVVESVLAAGERREGGVYNVGTGVETSVAELHSLCSKVTGSEREPLLAPPRAGDARRSVLDPSHAAAGLGWSARTSLERGIALTWEWLRKD
jgi:UDP-glucose 4-epimerase